MQRFANQNTKKSQSGLLLSILLFTALILILLLGVQCLNKKSQAEQENNLKMALNEACLQCYAIEGYYPESLDYLLEQYGIHYDTDQYFIDYRPIASNLMPEIVIIKRSSGGGQ